MVTYGCQMNLHESEKISGILSGMGMSAVNEPENADVVVSIPAVSATPLNAEHLATSAK